MNSKKKMFKVAIRCFTFNHEKYIEKALKGFGMQKTNFPYTAVVVDDASTDNEPLILNLFIKRELDTNFIEKEETNDYVKIVAPYKTNPNCTFAIILLKYNHYSIKKSKFSYFHELIDSAKYIALCEGDDFWTDPLKLQKQYDIMEKHPDCTICFNRVQAVYEDGITPEFMIPSIKSALCSGYIQLDNLIKEEFDLGRWCFQTSSFFVTKAISNGYITFKKENLPSFPYGDLPLIMFALTEGMGYFIDETMGCYRRFSGGFCSSLQANREKKIKTGYQVIKGCEEFDKYTNFKYHKMILKKIKREEFYVIYNKMSLRPRHWEFLVPEIYKCVCNKTKTTIRKVFPIV